MKIHVATVDAKSKKILSIMKVTDEHVHDSKALPELVVEDIIKSDITTVGKLFSDAGAYDGNDILDVYQTMEYCPASK